MEKDLILDFDDDPGINVEIEPYSLEDQQQSSAKNYDQTKFFPLECSNPITENNSGLLSVSSQNEQNEFSLDIYQEIQNKQHSAYQFIGGKKRMQDKVNCLTKFNYSNGQISINRDENSNDMFYGIFDGFGESSKISQYLSEQLPLQFFQNEDMNHFQKISFLVQSLHKQIQQLYQNEKTQNCGSTALFAVKTQEELIIANLGDSRALLLEVNDEESKCYQLTTDHSATHNSSEIERIEKMVKLIDKVFQSLQGGFIFDMRGIKRVQGELAVTRAFTNNQALQQFVAIEPEVNVIPLQKLLKKKSSFTLVMASDGL